MRTATLLVIAGFATSTLAYIKKVFKCIEPEPLCCTMVTTTGIGINCQTATLENMARMLDETTTDNEANSYDGIPFWVSVCYVSPGSELTTAQMPACCKVGSVSMTQNLEMFDCLPAEEDVGRYDSDLNSFLPTPADLDRFLNGPDNGSDYYGDAGYPIESSSGDDHRFDGEDDWN